MTKVKHFDNYENMISVIGALDVNLRRVASAFGVDIVTLKDGFRLEGEGNNVEMALSALDILEKLSARQELTLMNVDMVIESVLRGKTLDVDDVSSAVAVTARGKIVRAKTFGQKQYVDAIKQNGIVFGVGPAGTGKTYLAVALAVLALKSGEVDRIVLTRPAVEAGEKLGFLPGDLSEKVDPYLRPLFDALRDFLGEDAYQRHIDRGTIEIAPLAYMRGRTLSNSFIILDEAQNTTAEQMKMFLTRMGENSRIVVTGDVTQIDLPKSQTSGMKQAMEALADVKGIEIVKLSSKDVVRNEFVARIIDAYEEYEKRASLPPPADGSKEQLNG